MAATTAEDAKKGFITDTTFYTKCKYDIYTEIDKLLSNANRFQSIKERREESVFDMETFKKISKGKYCTRWRGLSMMKDCCDMVIYQQLIWEVKPKTIIETGAYTGACALWMADTAKIYGIDTRVFSIDIDLSMVEKLAVDDPNVDIRQGDVKQIAKSFPPEMLKNLAHPWIISEDCHVDVVGVMEYFHQHMQPGDYFIIEDTSPDTPLVSGQGLLEDIQYQPWGQRKHKLLKTFLEKYEEFYRIDCFYTDYFGYNGTFNWDGYIRRIK